MLRSRNLPMEICCDRRQTRNNVPAAPENDRNRQSKLKTELPKASEDDHGQQ